MLAQNIKTVFIRLMGVNVSYQIIVDVKNVYVHSVLVLQ